MNPKQLIKGLLLLGGYELTRAGNAAQPFHSWDYLRHTGRRLEHLASLNIPVFQKSVLEVGAGIGDHSHYYLDRGCRMTITEARHESIAYLRARYPEAEIKHLDMDNPDERLDEKFDVVHCYGLLYHLKNPAAAIAYLAARNTFLFFLETCVSFGAGLRENFVAERQQDPTQSITGTGCRPTREWVFAELHKHFEHVYCTCTQPNHPEFPVDWTRPDLHHAPFSRAVFVGSRRPLQMPTLIDYLPDVQSRHA